MKTAQAVVIFLSLVMLVAVAYALTAGNFLAEGIRLVAMPWGVATLVDVYVGFLLFAGWVWYRERSRWTALVWIVGLLLLGNLVSALYVALALRASTGDWKRFWMGASA